MQSQFNRGFPRVVARLRALGQTLCLAAAIAVAAPSHAADSRFFDTEDGWFDVSGFLDTAYGFVPVIAPITEPAVGYGAAAGAVFIDRRAPGSDQRYGRPNIAVLGALGTENGTKGLYAAHLGTWLDGRLRTTVALVDISANLDFYGLGADRGAPGLGYNVSPKGGTAGASYRIGEGPLWVGMRYIQASNAVTFGAAGPGLPPPPVQDSDLRLAALTPSITLDMRDNFFTPVRGAYVDLSMPLYREGLGGDRSFDKTELTGIVYHPLSRTLFSSVRASAKISTDGTPFYLRPYVALRGVQALRYQGERAADAEVELRWQLHSRFSVVAFAGAGTARSDVGQVDRKENVLAGGVGLRYFLARKHGLHVGLDVAAGPDKPAIYVVFGNAWLRP